MMMRKESTIHRLLTLTEAADFLRLHPRTLEAWTRGPSPKVPVIRLGRLIRFELAALERWVRENTNPPPVDEKAP
jgi:excisionase family DNA binding protein